MDFKNSVGFIVGNNGYVLKSNDSWSNLVSNYYWIVALIITLSTIIDDNNIIISSSNNIIKTSNGR